MVEVTQENVVQYRQPRRFFLFRGERQLLDCLIQPGMRVLDLGCGNGRISVRLLERGASVFGCDLSRPALRELQERIPARKGSMISEGDARQLPFRDCSFDAVVFAFAGLDYVYPQADRLRALREIERVLISQGYFIFSSHNPLGTLLSPRGLRSWTNWRWRVRYVLSAAWRRPYFRDYAGILLYQALPQKIIQQVARHTRMRFLLALGRAGSITSLPMLSLFSAGPYYIFVKEGSHAGAQGSFPPL